MSEAYNARQDRVLALPMEVYVPDDRVRIKNWE